MDTEQQYLDVVDQKLNQQNAFKAALLAPLYSTIVLVIWYWIYSVHGFATPIMLVLSGMFMGLFVRLHGKGFSALFSVLAVLLHLMIVASAFVMGMILGEGERERLFILVGLYAVGAFIAAFIARKSVPSYERKAFSQLTEFGTHKSSELIKNKWFATVPVASVIQCGLLLLTIFALQVFDTVDSYIDQEVKTVQREQRIEDKAIDVSVQNLDKMQYTEMLRHAFAYHTGNLPNKYGSIISAYPKSDYKSQTILKYLVKKNDSRAKYLLGLLTYQDGGLSLIQNAANDGDVFAKHHLAIEYGCDMSKQTGREMLNRLFKTAEEPKAKRRITISLNDDFNDICAANSLLRFRLDYIL